MSGIHDTATVTLNVNGAQAKQMMSDLESKIKQTEATIASMKANMADPKDIEKARKQLRTYQKQLEEMESATEGVNKALGNLDTASPRQLEKALHTLNRQLKDMEPGSKVWDEHVRKIKDLKNRLAEIRQEVAAQQSIWQRFTEWSIGAWPAFDLVSQGAGKVYDLMRGAVDAYASMDQEMANVRKFTGMTEEQVADLNEEFKNLDTRTSREDLNKLAQEAGRLGKTSQEDVLGFVRAADKINVALDDLGDGATLTLSKLTGIFGDEERYGTEQALLKVGSVINELSQNCSASAPYLAQFASRMGGVGAQAKMTIPQVLAFGAVLDSNGQQVEASSTALSQVIVRMMQEPAKYAKVAGLDVKKFSDMLKTDVNGALIMFLETLQKSGGMDVLSPMFKDMGENGSRTIAALSTLAAHIDQVKAQQEAANTAFREGTSIGTEFSVQNNTVAAALEKYKNRANELKVTLGDQLYPLMSHLLTTGSAVMKALAIVVNFISQNKGAVVSLIAAIAAYNVVVNLAIIKQNAWNAALVAWRATTITCTAASKLFAVAVALMTGNIQKAKTAWIAFSNALKLSPVGLLVAAIGGLVGVVTTFALKAPKATTEAERLAKAQRKIADAEKGAEANCSAEIATLDALYQATQNQNLAMDQRLAAVRRLQEQYPDYFKNLSDEAILAGDAADAYERLRSNIVRSAQAQARKDLLAETEGDILKVKRERDRKVSEALADVKIPERERPFYPLGEEGKEMYINSPDHPEFINTRRYIDNIRKSAAEPLAQLEKERELLYDSVSRDVLDNEPTPPSNPDGEEDRFTGGKEWRERQEAEERRAAIKAKEEFKTELDTYKAQLSASDHQVLELYKSGSIDYVELCRRRHENELKYYDDSLSHFKNVFGSRNDLYLEDDKDYQKLLLDREKSDEKYEENRIARELESIERRKSAEERSARHTFDVKSNPSVSDEIALEAELFAIRKKALDETLALYTEGSKKYADVKYQIETLEQERELTVKKLYFKAVSALRKEYDKLSASEMFELEKTTLDALLKARIITAEQYAKYLNGLTGKYKKDLPGSAKSSELSETQMKYDKDTQELKEALNSQIVTQAEFNERMASLDRERREKMLAGLKETGGEWNAMLSDVYLSFANLLDGLDGPIAGTLGNISSCVSAVSSVVGAGMQIATEFAKAESQIQIAAIEKRYDREIEMAQGNSYKVAKAEKKKEQETAKVKNKASKKQYQMQVVQAVAQSLVAGLNAYSSTLAIPIVGPALAPAAMAVALAMGAAQVALLKKQQQAAEAQGYSKGGFTKPGAVNEPAGIVHAGEWVASQKLLANPVARPMIDALDRAQRTNTIGSLRADDVSRSITANNSLVRIAEGDGSAALMVAAAVQMSRTVDNLTNRLNEPFVTVNTVIGDHGIKQAQDQYNALMRNITPKSQRK